RRTASLPTARLSNAPSPNGATRRGANMAPHVARQSVFAKTSAGGDRTRRASCGRRPRPVRSAGGRGEATGLGGRVTVQRMDNVGIVVESLDAAISFFGELGLELEGRATVEGEWAGR